MTRALRLDIPLTGKGYELREGEGLLTTSGDPEWITLCLHECINARVLRAHPQALVLHAASGSLGGRRFLLTGARASGKTTLALALLLRGASLFGDEQVWIEEGRVLPFPRRFHLKEGGLRLLADLGLRKEGLRPYPSFLGGTFYFFDPLDAGRPWVIEEGSMDALFALEPVFGGKTTLTPCPAWEMTERLLLEASGLDRDPAGHIRALVGAVRGSRCYTLGVGRPEEAAHAVALALGHKV